MYMILALEYRSVVTFVHPTTIKKKKTCRCFEQKIKTLLEKTSICSVEIFTQKLSY